MPGRDQNDCRAAVGRWWRIFTQGSHRASASYDCADVFPRAGGVRSRAARSPLPHPAHLRRTHSHPPSFPSVRRCGTECPSGTAPLSPVPQQTLREGRQQSVRACGTLQTDPPTVPLRPRRNTGRVAHWPRVDGPIASAPFQPAPTVATSHSAPRLAGDPSAPSEPLRKPIRRPHVVRKSGMTGWVHRAVHVATQRPPRLRGAKRRGP